MFVLIYRLSSGQVSEESMRLVDIIFIITIS